MLIVLPPSEGKTSPTRGEPMQPASLSFPQLDLARSKVLKALMTLCAKDPRGAAKVLGLGPTQHDEVRLNSLLAKAPAAPAVEVYTGVLYDALDAPTMTSAQRRRLDQRVVIASALFGFLRPNDLIPAYRLSGDVALPKIGALAMYWRELLSAALDTEPGVILDLRSGTYVALGPIPPAAAQRAVVGRVLLERGGKRSVVSHHNKATKGRLVRALMQSGSAPKNINALIAAITEVGFHCELIEPVKVERAATLDIIVREV
ncbi:MAG: peroxide stress protein YaaA [Actinomycetota bacterium]|nr:peroxide stress protein YaaA [Actinomycetota bacterium]